MVGDGAAAAANEDGVEGPSKIHFSGEHQGI